MSSNQIRYLIDPEDPDRGYYQFDPARIVRMLATGSAAYSISFVSTAAIGLEGITRELQYQDHAGNWQDITRTNFSGLSFLRHLTLITGGVYVDLDRFAGLFQDRLYFQIPSSIGDQTVLDHTYQVHSGLGDLGAGVLLYTNTRISTTEPTAGALGQQWFNPSNGQLYIYTE